MKKGIMSIVVCLMIVFGTAFAASAVEVTIDLDKVDPDNASAILREKQRIDSMQTKAEEAAKAVAKSASETATEMAGKIAALDPEKVDGWVDVAGNAVNRFCSIVNVQANELLTSPVGMVIVMLIALKLGAGGFVIDIIFIPVMMIMWFMGTSIYINALRKYTAVASEKKKFDKEGKVVETVTTQPLFEKADDKAAMSGVATLLFFVYTCLCIWVMVS